MVGFFDQISTQVISKWKKVTLIQKRGNKPTQINSQLLKPSFYDYLESFAIWGSNTTSTHLPHGFTPTNTCPTKNSINRYLSYVAFECQANFQITWGSFAHRDQHKKCLRYVAPEPQRWQMSIFGSWTDSFVNQLRAHSHIWVNPNLTNFIESKLSMWQNIANLNMNKRSSWNNQETIELHYIWYVVLDTLNMNAYTGYH